MAQRGISFTSAVVWDATEAFCVRAKGQMMSFSILCYKFLPPTRGEQQKLVDYPPSSSRHMLSEQKSVSS